MSTVTQELFDQISELDEEQQQALLEFARKLPVTRRKPTISLGEWLEIAEESRHKTREKYGENHYFNSQAMLDEIREEESE
jgi:hypothetical protein